MKAARDSPADRILAQSHLTYDKLSDSFGLRHQNEEHLGDASSCILQHFNANGRHFFFICRAFTPCEQVLRWLA